MPTGTGCTGRSWPLFEIERVSKLGGDTAEQRLDRRIEQSKTVVPGSTRCIAHDVNPRAYLHLVTKLIVRGWPNSKLRELLPDRMLAAHPELYVGERPALSASGPAEFVA